MTKIGNIVLCTEAGVIGIVIDIYDSCFHGYKYRCEIIQKDLKIKEKLIFQKQLEYATGLFLI